MAEPPTTPLRIAVGADGVGPVLQVDGEIDIDNNGQFADALHAAVDHGGDLRVDLSQVGYMDSSGLRSLLAAKAKVDEAGGSFEIVAASSITRRLLEITGLAGLLPPER